MPPTDAFSPRSLTLPTLAPGGRTLLERSQYDGVCFWWFAHTRLGWLMEWYRGRGEEAVAGIPLQGSPPISYLVRGLRGRLAARTVGTPRMVEDAARRVLFTGQNRQWPHEDGSMRDRFFGDVVDRLTERTVEAVSTYPLSGGRYPWGSPRTGLEVAKQRNDAATGVKHVPAEAVWDVGLHRRNRDAIRHFRRQAREVADAWEEAVAAEPMLRGPDADVARRLVIHTFQVLLPVAHFLTLHGRALVARTRPDLVLLINEYGFFECGLVQAAREAGVPVLAVQHGVIHGAHPGYAFPPEVLQASWGGSEGAYRAPVADRLAVYGEGYRRRLVDEIGWPAGRIVVTGHPKADRIHAIGPAPRNDDGPHRIVWLTQVHGLSPAENRQNEAAILGALRALPAAHLIVKPHPSDPVRLLASPPADLRVEVVAPDRDLYPILHQADVVITKDSTSALEAMAFDVPVVVLNTTPVPDRMDYSAKGAALRATDAASLQEALTTSLRSDPTAAARRHYVEDHLGAVDGRSVERLAQLVLEMARV